MEIFLSEYRFSYRNLDTLASSNLWEAMEITEKQLAWKKKIGRVGSNPVWEMATTGGLHLIAVNKSGKTEILGTGPHRAVARHIARKHCPEMVITDLNKADHVEIDHFKFCLPQYMKLTDRFRK